MIISAVLAVITLALVITNIFIPVKYLSAYIIFNKIQPESGKIRVTFLDVGQGNCTFAEFPDGKTLLIDGGNGRYVNELNILTFLNRHGVEKIDYMICTSVLPEHCGGLADILKYKQVGKIFMPYCVATNINGAYSAFYDEVRACGAETAICEYGEGVFAEDYAFCFLSPSAHNGADGEYAALNSSPTAENIANSSATVYLEYRNTSFLLLGDGTGDFYRKFVESHELNGGFEINGKKISVADCDILEVAGHGSAVSDCAELYDLVKPSTAIISLGAAPSMEAVSNAQRYARESFYRTDKDGTITVVSDGGKHTVSKEKQ